jgi:hypothetical protein
MRLYLRLALLPLCAAGLLAGCTTVDEEMTGLNWAGPKISPGRTYTPEAAIRRDVSGWAMLLCEMGSNNSVGRCSVIKETPTGWGFGQAAIKAQPGLNIRYDRSGKAIDLPRGELIFSPVVFCSAVEGEACRYRFEPEMRAFSAAAYAVLDDMRRGDCEAARTHAATIDAPGLVTLFSNCVPKAA